MLCKRVKRFYLRAAIACLGVAIALLVSFLPMASGQAVDQPSNPLLNQLDVKFSLPGVGNWLSNPNPGVSRQFVWLDGRQLFAIAVPDVGSSSVASGAGDPNSARTNIIEERLQQIVARRFDPKTLQVTFEIESNSRQPIIYVTYGTSDEQTTNELMTVTNLDAQIHSTDSVTWAGELTQIVETALLRARQERQSSFLRRQGLLSSGILLLAIAASLMVKAFQTHLRRQRRRLSAQAQDSTDAAVADNATQSAEESSGTTALLQQQMQNREKRRINEIERRLLQLGQTLIWGGSIFLILGLFPYSRWLQPTILKVLQIPLKLLIVFVITYLLIRLSEVLVDRFFWVLQDSASLAPEISQRVKLRFSTFARVVKSIVTLILVGTGILTSLSLVGLQVGPLLAGAGIIGLAVSFASQSVIKDMINGFLILLEDQYGVGDVIVVGDAAGLVENMNLRITQLRNSEGRLITIPNSSITVVQNLSKEWSRVDLTVNVAYHSNIDKALEVIDQVAQDMSRDRLWREIILESPQLLGIDQLDHMGATIRLWIKTQPLKQWDVAREYRRRLKQAFDAADIPIGVPQQSLWVSNAEDDLFDQHPKAGAKLTGNPQEPFSNEGGSSKN
jgi:small conductance mechanosensitive channel